MTRFRHDPSQAAGGGVGGRPPGGPPPPPPPPPRPHSNKGSGQMTRYEKRTSSRGTDRTSM